MKVIFAPTDFSKNANSALKYAIQLAQLYKCKIIFFHSIKPLIKFSEDSAEYLQILGLEKNKAELKLKREVEKILKSLQISSKKFNFDYLISGGNLDVVSDIVKASNAKKASLIVIGTHGATGLKKILFGSNTSALIDSSSIPVLAIPMGFRFKKPDEMIFATDLLNVKDEIKMISSINKSLKLKISPVYFDNGIANTVEEIKGIKQIKKSGLTLINIKIKLDAIINIELAKYSQKKKHSILCMFHENKHGIAKWILGSYTKDVYLQLKTPLLSFKI